MTTNKVFSLTVIPAMAHSRECFIATVAPGVPGNIVAGQFEQLRVLAESRNADWTMLKDCSVTVAMQPPGLWRRVCGWLGGNGKKAEA